MPIPNETEIIYGLLAFLRIGAILFAIPVFGDHPIPVRVRIILSVVFTISFFPMIPQTWSQPIPKELIGLLVLIIKEVIIGISIGYVSRLAFAGLLMAASIVGYQMGFGTANLMVADQVQQVNGFEAFHKMIIMLIFLQMDLHMFFFKGITESFEYIPLGKAYPQVEFLPFITNLSAGVFITALKLAAPVLIALMFTMAALGLVARAVPQMNIFTMSFPTSFFIGLFIYLATIPFYPEWFSAHFYKMFEGILMTIRGLA